MNIYQRGFAPILIIILISASIVGYLIYSGKINLNKTQPVENQTTQAPPVTGLKPVVLLIVEEGLDKQLKQELTTYSEDINRELNLTTMIKLSFPTDDVFTLKSFINDLYKTHRLNGVLLIGNIPTAEFVPIGNYDPVFSQEGAILSDYIYQDILDKCTYSSKTRTFSFENLACQQVSLNQPFWVARLTPNSSQKDSATLLKGYFKRNHMYRTGEFKYNQKILLYIPQLLDFDPVPREEIIYKIKDATKFLNMFSNKYNFINIEDQKSDQLYLKEIQKSHEYEIVYFDGHGSPTFHQKNLYPQDIFKTSFFYGWLSSCSVGRFTTKDYIAGQYLFNGDGLIITAASTPTAFISEIPRELFAALSKGAPFYEAIQIGGTGAVNILGDPTLKMRYTKNTQSYKSYDPIIEIVSPSTYYLPADQKISLTVKNTGKSDLFFYINANYYQQERGEAARFGINFNPGSLVGEGKSFGLQPEQEGTITLENDAFYSDKKDVYTIKIFVSSNDPVKPYQVLSFNLEKK